MRSAREANELPVFGIDSPFEAKLFAAGWVFDGDVVLARPVDLQVGLPKRRKKLGAVCDLSLFDLHEQVGVDGVLGLRAFVLVGCCSPPNQTGFVQVRVFRRPQASSGRIVRSGPALAVIVQVPEHVEVLLPARRAGIERLAA
jgi:hypothetical protein